MNLADVNFTNHFIKQAKHKGFTAEQIAQAIEQTDPRCKITPVTRHPGQMRYCGFGEGSVAVVMQGNTAITIYLNGVITPRREDQADDEAAISSKRLAKIG